MLHIQRRFIPVFRSSRTLEIFSWGLLTLPCLISAFIAYLDFRYVFSFVWTSSTVLPLLIALVLRRIWKIWKARRQGKAGSQLHVQVMTIFGLLVTTPIVLMAFLFLFFMHLGINTWFNEVVKTAIHESKKVLQVYLKDQNQTLDHHLRLMVHDLETDTNLWVNDQDAMEAYLTAQTHLRGLNEAVIIQTPDQVIARSEISFSLEFEEFPYRQIGPTNIMTYWSRQKDRIIGLARIFPEKNLYLWVSRFVDPQVLARMSATDEAVGVYELLLKERKSMAFQLTFLFFLLALLLLCLGVWGGLNVANHLIEPIKNLIEAADKVKQGDLSVQIPLKNSLGELEALGDKFNQMVVELSTQRKQLIQANQQLENRRKFMENVLAGVSSGVIGLDHKGTMTLQNRAALGLLNLQSPTTTEISLEKVSPELQLIFTQAQQINAPIWSQQVTRQNNGQTQILQVVLRGNWTTPDSHFVMTLDDVTGVFLAQRQAAWSEVARRIAHEIKNPLTPIQLAAERLKRKYLQHIPNDPQTFQACIDTISRQARAIGKMVNEFISFARLPLPIMEKHDVILLCQQVISLQEVVSPDIEFSIHTNTEPIFFTCDAQQLTQALLNVLKNAVEAIEERFKIQSSPTGSIKILITPGPSTLTIQTIDNGIGFPMDTTDKLMEPYITTKPKGTGLGLAIVKKIIEDHGGTLSLHNQSQDGGGCVTFIFHNERPLATKGTAVT